MKTVQLYYYNHPIYITSIVVGCQTVLLCAFVNVFIYVHYLIQALSGKPVLGLNSVLHTSLSIHMELVIQMGYGMQSDVCFYLNGLELRENTFCPNHLNRKSWITCEQH